MKARPDDIKVPHRLAWLWEPLEARPGFALRSMFGTKAIYLDGRMLFAIGLSREPWRGMLVCTSLEHHASLINDFPGLKPHQVLGKWLYLPERHERFESIAEQLVRLALRGDPRVGIIPPLKKKKKRATAAPR